MQKAKTKVTHSRAKQAVKEPTKKWQLQTAKARFSELFRSARSEGPQLITRQGKEGVVQVYFRNPGDLFQKDIFNVGLGGRGQRSCPRHSPSRP